jgi:hypothetical protein
MQYSPRKAIKVKCMDCCCGSLQEVQKCTVRDYALWPYRWGKVDFAGAIFPPKFYPNRIVKQMSDEQKEANKARLKAYHFKKGVVY